MPLENIKKGIEFSRKYGNLSGKDFKDNGEVEICDNTVADYLGFLFNMYVGNFYHNLGKLLARFLILDYSIFFCVFTKKKFWVG